MALRITEENVYRGCNITIVHTHEKGKKTQWSYIITRRGMELIDGISFANNTWDSLMSLLKRYIDTYLSSDPNAPNLLYVSLVNRKVDVI